jgi:predicted nucleotidyltransferase
MNRKEAVRILCAHESALHARGVTRLALFGSLARGESGEDSDIDVVVDIDPGRVFSLIDLADLRLYLCDLFGRETDVVIRDDLRPRFRDRIAADEVAVF